MSKAFWQQHSIKPTPKKPGLALRERQLTQAQEASSSLKPPAGVVGMPNVNDAYAEHTALESRVQRAKNALKRQQDVQ
jgi:hypothetical protein